MKIVECASLSKITYPFLGVNETGTCRIVVMFTSPSCGVVMKSSDWGMYQEGMYSDDWAEDNFDYFTGELIISND